MSQVRTGVIVGTNGPAHPSDLLDIAKYLSQAFPSVKFAVVANATSVAFQYEEDEK